MNEANIWDKLITSGMTTSGAAGLMGNLYAESGLNPINLENQYERKLGFTDETYTAAVDSGTYQNFVNDYAGYGLAQWTYFTRKKALLEFSIKKGCSVGDLDMQLEFLITELKVNFPTVWQILTTTDSVRIASDMVMTQFERPADTSEAAKAKRASFGQKYFDMFALSIPETPPMPELPSGCECSCCDHNDVTATQRTYTVASGDTLTRVAKTYGTSVQAILDANRGTYPDMTADLIRVGWVLKV